MIIERLKATFFARGGQLCELLLRASAKVKSGPFRGMKGLSKAYHSALTPKLLGTYELEIEQTVEDCIRSNPDTIINVGAAEGYYIVGLLLRLPNSNAIAFETDDYARQLLINLARINGVSDRLSVSGTASEESLFQSLSSRNKCLLIMDIEGAELSLMSDRVFSCLNGSDAIIELHGSAKDILNFPIKIHSRTRTPNDFPYQNLSTLWHLCPKSLTAHIMNEYRPEEQIWGIIRSGSTVLQDV